MRHKRVRTTGPFFSMAQGGGRKETPVSAEEGDRALGLCRLTASGDSIYCVGRMWRALAFLAPQLLAPPVVLQAQPPDQH